MHKLVSSALLSIVLLGTGASLPQNAVSAHRVHHHQPVMVAKQVRLSKEHVKKQKQTKILKNVRKTVKKDHNRKWFKHRRTSPNY